jgi:hypothetical protein
MDWIVVDAAYPGANLHRRIDGRLHAKTGIGPAVLTSITAMSRGGRKLIKQRKLREKGFEMLRVSSPSNQVAFPRFLLVWAALASFHASSTKAASPTTSGSGDVIGRIALLGDPHVSREVRYAEYVNNFNRVIDQVNAADVDAVLVAGDLMQSARPEAFDAFKEMAGRFKAKAWFVAGNHDVGDKPLPGKPATVTGGRMAQFEQMIGPAFFAEQILPRVRVIGITSSLLGSGLAREQEQWDFLEKQLGHPRDGITLLLTHYPPFADSSDEPDAYFNMVTPARQRMFGLLQRGGVKTILSAHLHRPVEHDWDGIRIIGAPAVSFGLPEGQQKSGWTLVTLHADGRAAVELHYLENITVQPSTAPAAGAATRPIDAAELLHSMEISTKIPR